MTEQPLTTPQEKMHISKIWKIIWIAWSILNLIALILVGLSSQGIGYFVGTVAIAYLIPYFFAWLVFKGTKSNKAANIVFGITLVLIILARFIPNG